MDKASLHGRMAVSTKESFMTTIFRDLDCMSGLMGASTRATGNAIRWMEGESLPGLTAEGMKGIITMIRSKGMELLSGQMEGSILGHGIMESNMGGECIWLRMEAVEKESGTWERGSGGPTNDDYMHSLILV
jgi:hypothetical protein